MPVVPDTTSKIVFWNQTCSEQIPYNQALRCGDRRYKDLRYRGYRTEKGQASPGEFPWVCMVLLQSNDYVGACAIIPDNKFNDVIDGTDRVIMAAHKLKKMGQNE